MRWFWGLVIILIGIVLLGINFNLWDPNQIEKLGQFWPLTLILLGIALIVRHLRFGWIIILLVFLGFLILAYLTVLKDDPLIKTKELSRSTNSQVSRFSEKMPENLKKAKVIIDTGAVELRLDDSSSNLVEGIVTSDLLAPNLNTSISNDEATIRISTKKIAGSWWGTKNKMEISITNKIPIELQINSGASSIYLDAKDLSLNKLDINSGASTIDVKLGKVENNGELSIDSGASSIKILVPKDLGLEINTATAISSKNFQGFSKTDNIYKIENYDAKPNKAKLNIKAGASSIEIKTY